MAQEAAEARLAIHDVPEKISRIFFGDPQPPSYNPPGSGSGYGVPQAQAPSYNNPNYPGGSFNNNLPYVGYGDDLSLTLKLTQAALIIFMIFALVAIIYMLVMCCLACGFGRKNAYDNSYEENQMIHGVPQKENPNHGFIYSGGSGSRHRSPSGGNNNGFIPPTRPTDETSSPSSRSNERQRRDQHDPDSSNPSTTSEPSHLNKQPTISNLDQIIGKSSSASSSHSSEKRPPKDALPTKTPPMRRPGTLSLFENEDPTGHNFHRELPPIPSSIPSDRKISSSTTTTDRSQPRSLSYEYEVPPQRGMTMPMHSQKTMQSLSVTTLPQPFDYNQQGVLAGEALNEPSRSRKPYSFSYTQNEFVNVQSRLI